MSYYSSRFALSGLRIACPALPIVRYSQRKRLIATRAHATATPSITIIGSSLPYAGNPRRNALIR